MRRLHLVVAAKKLKLTIVVLFVEAQFLLCLLATLSRNVDTRYPKFPSLTSLKFFTNKIRTEIDGVKI